MRVTFPDPSMNQPPWVNACLREIETRSYKLKSWEWFFVGQIRDDIYFGRQSKITDKRLQLLSSIRNWVFERSGRPPGEKERKPGEYKAKQKTKSWVQD